MPDPRDTPPYRRSRVPEISRNPDNTPPARAPRGHDDPALARELERAEEERVRILKDAEEKEYQLRRELEREKRKSQVDISVPSYPPPSRRSHRPAADYIGAGVGGTSLVGVLVMIMKLWGDQKGEIQDLKNQVVQQAAKEDRLEKRVDGWKRYALELKVADECRFKQVCSGLAHLDYGCSDTDYSDVQWSPKEGSWKRNGTPATRAIGECPKVPTPPDE
jgi:hypothetical protein